MTPPEADCGQHPLAWAARGRGGGAGACRRLDRASEEHPWPAAWLPGSALTPGSSFPATARPGPARPDTQSRSGPKDTPGPSPRGSTGSSQRGGGNLTTPAAPAAQTTAVHRHPHRYGSGPHTGTHPDPSVSTSSEADGAAESL